MVIVRSLSSARKSFDGQFSTGDYGGIHPDLKDSKEEEVGDENINGGVGGNQSRNHGIRRVSKGNFFFVDWKKNNSREKKREREREDWFRSEVRNWKEENISFFFSNRWRENMLFREVRNGGICNRIFSVCLSFFLSLSRQIIFRECNLRPRKSGKSITWVDTSRL